jgi:ribosomal-protein-alanine N-acetyltransferase
VITTDRLVLRRWTEADRAPFAALNADPEVMRYFPSPLTRAQSDATVDAMEARFETDGYGHFAVERREDGRFLGFVGLQPVLPPVPVAPAVEIGWRLARHAWGQGYASEAATACLDLAFRTLDLEEVVSFTAAPNLPSQAVMQRIGMQRDLSRDFLHPRVEDGNWLKPHLVYAIRRP